MSEIRENNPDLVWDEAHIERNVRELEPIFREISADHMSVISSIEGDARGLLELLDLPSERLSMMNEKKKAQLAALPAHIETISSMIQALGITEKIDQVFVEDTIKLLDDTSADDGEKESTFEEIMQNLHNRNVLSTLEISSQARIPVQLSNDRQMAFIVDGVNEKVSFDLPFVNDPRQTLVELGPNAVTEILGAPLTDDDYAAIASAMKEIPGVAGEAIQQYAAACEKWAAIEAVKGDASVAQSERKEASRNVHKIFDYDMNDDIVLNALWTTAVRRHPSLDHFETPQPYRD